MDELMEKYEQLERLLDEEKIYLDREVTFSRVCGWLKVPVVVMDALLKHELGVDGEELFRSLRASEEARMKLLYGIDVFF